MGCPYNLSLEFQLGGLGFKLHWDGGGVVYGMVRMMGCSPNANGVSNVPSKKVDSQAVFTGHALAVSKPNGHSNLSIF